MKTYCFRGFCLILASLWLVSCNPGIYCPAFQNVPLFQKKGEVNLMVNQTNLQVSMAVGSHIGVAVNAQYVNQSSRKFLTPKDWPNTKQVRLELAGGYFTQQKTTRSPILELYAGGGYGGANYAVRNIWIREPPTDYRQYDLTIPSRNWNVFMQPAIGFRSKRSSIALSAKVNYLGFVTSAIELNPPADQSIHGPDPQYDDLTRYEKLTQLLNSNCLFIEPALTASTGGNRLKVMIQLFTWLPIINPSQYELIDRTQTHVRVGLWLGLNRKTKHQGTI